MRTISLLIVLPVLLYCCRKVNGPWANVNAKFDYINDTRYEITLIGECGFDEMGNPYSATSLTQPLMIPPGDVLTVHQHNRRLRHPPDVNTDDFALFYGSCYAVYGDSLACDIRFNDGIRGINNYERKEEVSENNFELTYRFTEQTMKDAQPCPDP